MVLLSLWIFFHCRLLLSQILKYRCFSGARPRSSSLLTLHPHSRKSHLSLMVSITLYILMTSKLSFSAPTALKFTALIYWHLHLDKSKASQTQHVQNYIVDSFATKTNPSSVFFICKNQLFKPETSELDLISLLSLSLALHSPSHLMCKSLQSYLQNKALSSI